MRRWFQVISVLALLAAAPAAAHAGLILEGSFGKGAKLAPSPVAAEPTNFMLAPGLTFSILRLELGFVWDLPDVGPKEHNFELRPMLVVSPPLIPLYGRAIFAVTNLAQGKTEWAWGAAGGLSIGIGPIGVFAEAGVLPRSRDSRFTWVVEGRLGASVGF